MSHENEKKFLGEKEKIESQTGIMKTWPGGPWIPKLPFNPSRPGSPFWPRGPIGPWGPA